MLILAARACWRLWNDHRRFMAALDVVGPLPGHPEVTVIEDPKLTAFCAGFVHPKVYISRGVLRLLSREETDAVLLHERHHCGTRDPLRLAFASVLTQALFFLPLVRRLRESYAELAEAGADQAAVRAHQGDSGAMASALLAFDAEAPPGTAGISSQRVDSLLGQPPPWGVSAWLVAIGLCSLAGLVVVVWLTSEAASAGASFNLPIISSNPCALVLALLPLVAGATALIGRGRLFPVRKHS